MVLFFVNIMDSDILDALESHGHDLSCHHDHPEVLNDDRNGADFQAKRRKLQSTPTLMRYNTANGDTQEAVPHFRHAAPFCDPYVSEARSYNDCNRFAKWFAYVWRQCDSPV
jgi:hypothetical protein